MRIHVRHEIIQTFDTEAKGLNSLLRLTPRSHEGQHVLDWRIDVDADCRLRSFEDAFGNLGHAFSLPGPLTQLRMVSDGSVETFDTAGIVRNAVERFPPELYLRETDLTAPDAAMRAFAQKIEGADAIERLHGLLVALGDRMNVSSAPEAVERDAAAAFAQGEGGPGELAQVFIACARSIGAPARYVSGHYVDPSRTEDIAACHAWAEAYVPDVGWIGFDPTHGLCPHESHVRIACGLDALDAAPLRSASQTSGTHATLVSVRLLHVDDAPARSAGQRQQ